MNSLFQNETIMSKKFVNKTAFKNLNISPNVKQQKSKDALKICKKNDVHEELSRRLYTMTRVIDNVNPNVYDKGLERVITDADRDENVVDEFDRREIFDMIRHINDPEHPLTLEELKVVEEDGIFLDNANNSILIKFTPTIPHCSMATLIGLSIRVQLLRALPSRFKVTVKVTEGSHASEDAVNKQLADKERIAAALENISLVAIINQCVMTKNM